MANEQQAMTLQQAARWAERRGALYIGRGFDNPMCAVYDASWKAGVVLCVGSVEKCKAFMVAAGVERPSFCGYDTTRDGKTVRLYDLPTVLDEMGESEGEAACIPDAWEQREWA